MLFYDPNTILATLDSISYNIDSIIPKIISGITYLTTNSNFNIKINNINQLNNLSYPSNQLEINSSGIGVSDFYLKGSQITGWNNQYDISGLNVDTLKPINMSNFLCCGISRSIRSRTLDWTSNAWVTSNSETILINTYVADSTNTNSSSIIERFRDERERLRSDCSAWDSALLLNSDELMVSCNELSVQHTNWSNYLPHGLDGIIEPDYSISGGSNQYYYRAYQSANGIVKSNGVFTFNGLTESDLTNGDIKIEISLDSIVWYDMNKSYLGGSLQSDEGCRINKDSIVAPNIAFTLSTYNTGLADSGMIPENSFLLRITMPQGSNVRLSSANLVW